MCSHKICIVTDSFNILIFNDIVNDAFILLIEIKHIEHWSLVFNLFLIRRFIWRFNAKRQRTVYVGLWFILIKSNHLSLNSIRLCLFNFQTPTSIWIIKRDFPIVLIRCEKLILWCEIFELSIHQILLFSLMFFYSHFIQQFVVFFLPLVRKKNTESQMKWPNDIPYILNTLAYVDSVFIFHLPTQLNFIMSFDKRFST